MSGIYIPGMEIPKRCIACQLNYDSCACILTGSRYYKHGVEFDPGEGRLPDCPLVPVTEHGRLGDLDELLDRAFGCLDEETFLAFQFLVNGSVTIIPAEEGEG